MLKHYFIQFVCVITLFGFFAQPFWCEGFDTCIQHNSSTKFSKVVKSNTLSFDENQEETEDTDEGDYLPCSVPVISSFNSSSGSNTPQSYRNSNGQDLFRLQERPIWLLFRKLVL